MNKLKKIWNILVGSNRPKIQMSDSMGNGEKDNYLIDVQRGSYNTSGWEDTEAIDEDMMESTSPRNKTKKTQKICVKPIDILDEIKEAPKLFSLVGLDSKIEILKLKKELVTQRYTTSDLNGIIQLLENRKKYKGSVAMFYSQFSITTKEKIDTILAKYELVMKSPDIFIPEFPDEAVKIMKKYSDTTYKLCKKKPTFYVIATSDMFKDEYKKRDPILLAVSPFGMYYDILGAWDKEMIILNEL